MTYQELIKKKACPICKQSANIDCNEIWDIEIECPKCGKYKTTRELIEDDFVYSKGEYDLEKLSSYLYYHKSDKLIAFLGTSIETPGCSCVSPQTVENWYPKTFAQKIDLILLKLKEDSKYDGESIIIKDEILFLKNGNESMMDSQRQYIHNFLLRIGYIEKMYAFTYTLTPKALERVYELQKTNRVNKDVFVSMAFNGGTKDTREAIRSGITNAGFSSKFIDEIIHNHQIMPEMFRLIRECRFLILEISDPNYGAYYEAGYALGLGKEVIICCKEEIFNKEYTTDEEKKYAKYLKPHFDIAQKQILVWKDYEDLTKKLCEWIKALI